MDKQSNSQRFCDKWSDLMLKNASNPISLIEKMDLWRFYPEKAKNKKVFQWTEYGSDFRDKIHSNEDKWHSLKDFFPLHDIREKIWWKANVRGQKHYFLRTLGGEQQSLEFFFFSLPLSLSLSSPSLLLSFPQSFLQIFSCLQLLSIFLLFTWFSLQKCVLFITRAVLNQFCS